MVPSGHTVYKNQQAATQTMDIVWPLLATKTTNTSRKTSCSRALDPDEALMTVKTHAGITMVSDGGKSHSHQCWPLVAAQPRVMDMALGCYSKDQEHLSGLWWQHVPQTSSWQPTGHDGCIHFFYYVLNA